PPPGSPCGSLGPPVGGDRIAVTTLWHFLSGTPAGPSSVPAGGKTMRRIIVVLFALTLLLGVVDRAAAQILSTTVTVDENGHGTIMFPGGGTIPLASALGQDTGPGGRSNALIYSLFSPPGLTGGDVIVTEPGGQVGDLLRFNPDQIAPDQTPGVLVFY